MNESERSGVSEVAVDWTDVGGRIKRLRRERHLSQAELGAPVISASYLSLIESGTRRPTQKVLAHVANRLGVEPDELVTGRSRKDQIAAEFALQEAREAIRVGDDARAELLAKDAAEKANLFGLTRVQARACEILGGIEEGRNRIDTALQLYAEAERLWGSHPPHLAFQAMAGVARCHQGLGNPRLAVHILETYLLELDWQGVPDPTATMRTQAALVNCYSALGLKDKAAKAAEEAQALAPRVSDAEQLACMNMNVARSLYEQGRMDDALDALRRAEESYLTIGWELDAASAKLNRGIVRIDKGDAHGARADLTDALLAFKAADHPADVARTLNELGRLERVSGNSSQAEDLLREAQPYLKGGDFTERALNLRELGLCIKERDPTEAKGHLRRAIDLYVLAGAGTDAASTYKLLGDLHAAVGEVHESAAAYRAGIEAIEQ